jgi:hypothetical protein
VQVICGDYTSAIVVVRECAREDYGTGLFMFEFNLLVWYNVFSFRKFERKRLTDFLG